MCVCAHRLGSEISPIRWWLGTISFFPQCVQHTILDFPFTTSIADKFTIHQGFFFSRPIRRTVPSPYIHKFFLGGVKKTYLFIAMSRRRLFLPCPPSGAGRPLSLRARPLRDPPGLLPGGLPLHGRRPGDQRHQGEEVRCLKLAKKKLI